MTRRTTLESQSSFNEFYNPITSQSSLSPTSSKNELILNYKVEEKQYTIQNYHSIDSHMTDNDDEDQEDEDQDQEDVEENISSNHHHHPTTTTKDSSSSFLDSEFSTTNHHQNRKSSSSTSSIQSNGYMRVDEDENVVISNTNQVSVTKVQIIFIS